MINIKSNIKNATVIKLILSLRNDYSEPAPGSTMIEWLDNHVGRDNYETIYDYQHRARHYADKTCAILYHFRKEEDAALFALRWA